MSENMEYIIENDKLFRILNDGSKQHVQYELDRLKNQHPVCKSETKLNVIW